MGFLDNVKGLVDKGKELAAEHPDKVNQAIEKAGDLADNKTGGKFSGQVDAAENAAKNALGTN
ncbi:MAG: antitoxin [Rhodococcus sp. (in: high G+C Gram-positive bacteria)]|uniref:antitoxin n=1 Tax=Rhodococcus sp. TaxID=1831 RepID=UPI003BB6994B